MAVNDGLNRPHLVGHSAVAVGLLEIAPFCQGLVAHLFAQLDHRIEDRLGARRAARQVEVYGDQLVHAAHGGGGICRKHAACDRAGTHGDHVFGLGHLLVQPNQGRSHFHGHGAGDDQQVCLARAGAGHQAEAIEIKAGADQGSKFDEAAGGAIEQGPEAAEAGPVVDVIEGRENDVLREL